MNKSFTAAATLAALLAAATLTGCAYSPGGSMMSDGTHCYVSTAHAPVTVTLVDTRSLKQLLVVEVPVGQQAVLRFYGLSEDEGEQKATLQWGLMKAGTSYGGLTNTLEIPPSSACRIDLSYRRAPEYARPLIDTQPAELPQGVTIADGPGTKPTTQAPAGRPVEVETTSPRAPKVDIPE